MFLLLSQYSYSYQRKVPMSELTNPRSRSYVPIPYPKTRNEVVKDVKCYLEKHRGRVKAYLNKSRTKNVSLYIFDIKATLFLKNSKYKVGEIVFVKDRSFTTNHKNLKDNQAVFRDVQKDNIDVESLDCIPLGLFVPDDKHSIGNEIIKGVLLAVDEANAKGGHRGKNFCIKRRW